MSWRDLLHRPLFGRRPLILPAGTPIITCLTCALSHRLPPDPRQRIASEQGFADRHAGHRLTFGELAGLATYLQYGVQWNSDVKLALQPVQTMTVTNLHSLANSATAGWQSAVVDNTSNLFLDAFAQCVFDFANTAPANSKCVYIFGSSGIESGVLSNPASGSEGTITLVDVTANAQALDLLKVQPYTTQDEVSETGAFSVAPSGSLPPFWGLAIINHSGAALNSSGNTVKYRGLYATVI